MRTYISLFYTITILFSIISCNHNHQNQISVNLEKSPDSLQIFGKNIISTHLYERDLAMDPEGNELIFSIGDYKQQLRCLVSIKKQNGIWGKKEILPFSGRYDDIEPFFTPDGMALYFASSRPIYGDSSRADFNIWKSIREEKIWTDPIPLDSIINTTGNEFYPAIASSGNLYFTAVRDNGIGSEDIFISRFVNGFYKEPIPLDTSINTNTFEFNAYVSPDEDLIVFSSYGRPDGNGGGDLYYSIKNGNDQWDKSKNMLHINSIALDYCPFIDFKNENFYFTSEISEPINLPVLTVNQLEEASQRMLNGMGNIYRINLNEVIPNYKK